MVTGKRVEICSNLNCDHEGKSFGLSEERVWSQIRPGTLQDMPNLDARSAQRRESEIQRLRGTFSQENEAFGPVRRILLRLDELQLEATRNVCRKLVLLLLNCIQRCTGERCIFMIQKETRAILCRTSRVWSRITEISPFLQVRCCLDLESCSSIWRI